MRRRRKGRSAMRTSLLTIISLILLSLSICTQSEVITLTSDTFTDKIKEKDTAWFVKFCNLGSLWDDLGKAMEGEDEIEVGEVDCGLEKTVCTKVDIHSYPTFKVFYDGEEVARYQGSRDVGSMKTFVLEESEKAAAKALDSDKELHPPPAPLFFFFSLWSLSLSGLQLALYRRWCTSGFVFTFGFRLRHPFVYVLISICLFDLEVVN
ncbi:Protein disulfide-isomerase 5-1, partial [Mucuna pruriens]